MTEAYFQGGHWGQCFELLNHLCQYSESILLVTGPVGIGKSSMRRALSGHAQEGFTVCDIEPTPGYLLTAQDIAEQIESKTTKPNQELLLLIDDADTLPLEVFVMLFRLHQRASVNNGVHIILFATAELSHKLAASVLNEDFVEQVHTIELEPLTLSELQAFLLHSWRATRSNSTFPFSNAQCKKIYSLSGGIPGKVQQVANEMLASTTAVHRGLSPVMIGVTVSFGVLFCVLALLWPAADYTAVVASANTTVPTVTAPAATKPAEPHPDAAPELAQTAPDDERITRLENKLLELQTQLASEHEARHAAELKYQAVLNKPSTHGSKKVLSLSQQEKQILAIPKSNYTLQIVGLRDEQKIKAFIKKHNLAGKAHYFRGLYKNRPWYVLTYGNYKDKAAAQAAIKQLPLAIQKLRPWPRAYVHVQEALHDFEQHK